MKKIEIGKIEQKEKFNPVIEIGNYENIKFVVNFYAIGKIIHNKWGNEQGEDIANNIKNKNIKIDQNLINLFEEVEKLTKNNREALRWLAFASSKGERVKCLIIDQIVKHKGIKKEQAEKLFFDFENFSKELESKFDFGIITKNFIDKDIRERKEDLPKLKEKIKEAINFFNPQNSNINKVVYLPTNPLERKYSGNGIDAGEVFYVSADKGNRQNEIHEFLHCVINPIIDKLKLTKEEEKIILEKSSRKLKDYKTLTSILTEEIIRTYKTGFIPENKPSIENYKKVLLNYGKDNLQKLLDKQSDKKGLGLTKSADELLNNENILKKYYEAHLGDDKLTEKIWEFFGKYKENKVNNFEGYFLKNYKDVLK